MYPLCQPAETPPVPQFWGNPREATANGIGSRAPQQSERCHEASAGKPNSVCIVEINTRANRAISPRIGGRGALETAFGCIHDPSQCLARTDFTSPGKMPPAC